ncbi:MAG: Ycf34 family protein, partial [Prochlorococcaceae cyanobacterium]
MCICVDCHWVDRCQAYHAVERQHGVAHLSPEPDFQPRAPRIHVQVLDLPGGGVGVE